MNSCVKCGGTMSEGFVLDRGDHGSASVSHWHDKAPDRRWYGLKTSKGQQFTISTFRCGRCGYLESFAKEPAQ